MAARQRNFHNEKSREAIRDGILKRDVTQLINVLWKHGVDGEEIDPSRIRSIEVLLKKVLPDLKAIEGQIDVGGELRVSWVDPHTIQSEAITGAAASEPEQV